MGDSTRSCGSSYRRSVPSIKRAHAGGMPAYAPTAKEREIVEKARLRDAPQEWSRQYAMLGLILAS